MPVKKLLENIKQLIEIYNINLINVIFIAFTTVIVVFGSLMSLIEPQLPTFLRQSLRYGKHSFKGPANSLVSKLEVPKSWFKHFYVFAFAWSMLALLLVLKGIVLNVTAPECVLTFLDVIAGGSSNRKVEVSSTCGLVATVLMTMQCTRRFYETNFVQIFSKKSTINISHYMVAYIHYFGVIVSLLANTEGFVRGSRPSAFALSQISLLQYLCVFIFHFSWTQQYKSNMILVNLRKDGKTGAVVTEQHLLPTGGFFNMISSPHMFFEVVMYLVVLGLMPNCTTWYYVASWVVSNQIANAMLTHKWYQENFKNYPRNRYAIIPFVL